MVSFIITTSEAALDGAAPKLDKARLKTVRSEAMREVRRRQRAARLAAPSVTAEIARSEVASSFPPAREEDGVAGFRLHRPAQQTTAGLR